MADKLPESLDKTVLLDNLSKIQYTVDKTYFSRLQDDYGVLPFEKYNQGENSLSYPSDVRAIRIDRFVYNLSEKSEDCFQNVLSLYSGSSDALAFVFKRTFEHMEIFAVVRSGFAGDGERSTDGIKALQESFKGNFAGSHTEIVGLDGDILDSDKIEAELWDKIDVNSIAATCNVPSAKSEKYLSQGIEKVLNGIIPASEHENYMIIVLAESLSNLEVDTVAYGYEEMSTAVHPFISHQFQMGENEAKTTGEMNSVSETESTSIAITKTHSVNVGVNGSRSSSVSAGISCVVNLGASMSKSVGTSAGYGYSRSKTEQKGHASTRTFGTQNSVTLGTSQSTTYMYQSYEVKNLQRKLEIQSERIKKGKAIGLWRYATFVCAESPVVSKNVANALRSITQGETSYIEPAIIQEWSFAETNGVSDFDEIKKYVKHFCHPIFANKEDGTPVYFSSYINTGELVNAIAFPRTSVMDLPIITCASFGMEPHSLDKINQDIEIGFAYHMYEKNEHKKIYLDKKELTKHTFITGSTGSGKSNTVYYLLNSLANDGIKFMVIEPAKGEYKDVFRQRTDVHVYGTNANVSDILRINPFAFPEKVHVLEHIDRLTEIFNVCWPMYAAMPAILKDAIERSYVVSGWNLVTSENRYGKGDNRIFPSFADVLSEIKNVMDESEYSDENKGDYVGSLSTRVRSLTTGINGIIFGGDYLDDKKLFEENVIVDLSRVGASETKSLIMGILILKLQEFRMGKEESKVSDDLNHVTVLEEAHNILKRTSFEQSNESSNLIGKSVEMISNSIAEMRTYGEGFIIVDQAPQLLDMSAIRNTNTKIVMRLPDYGDRELVGKAIGLDADQLKEMSRFKQGIAVISQSGWIEPVLCAIHEYKYTKGTFKNPIKLSDDGIRQTLLKMIMTKEITHFSRKSIEEQQRFINNIVKSNLKGSVKSTLLECLEKNDDIVSLQKLIYEFFDSKECLKRAEGITDVSDWTHFVVSSINPPIVGYTANQRDAVIALILAEHVSRDSSYKGFVTQYALYIKGNGGVM